MIGVSNKYKHYWQPTVGTIGKTLNDIAMTFVPILPRITCSAIDTIVPANDTIGTNGSTNGTIGTNVISGC